MSGMRTALLLIACWLLFTGTAQAALVDVTRTDDPAGPGNCPADCSLRQAIAFADPEDTVRLAGGPNTTIYALTRGTLEIGKSLTITGTSPQLTGIDGAGNIVAGSRARTFKTTAGTIRIEKLTLQNGENGRDENFCSGCPAINENGGGALFNQGANVTLDRVVVENSRSLGTGGAISNAASLALVDVDIHVTRSAFGSGIFQRNGTLTVDRSTVRDGDNTRGAVFINGGTAALTNVTVTGSGQPSSVGGGVVNAGGALTLVNSTLADNDRGSLLTYTGATTSARNTIFGAGYGEVCVEPGTPGVPQATDPITNENGGNFAEDATCGLPNPPVPLKLAPLTDNQGSTPTFALLAGSPAIDAASGCPPFDQRGKLRQLPCDAGAFEAERLGAPTVTTGAASDISARDARVSADFNLGGEAGALTIELGTAPDQLTPYTTIGAGVVPATTQRTLSLAGVEPETTYHYRAVADNATGRAVGAIRTFTTPPAPPEIIGAEIYDTSDTTAEASFRIEDMGHATSYVVTWHSQNHEGRSRSVPVTTNARITHPITGLVPGTEYEIDIIATNAGGSTNLGAHTIRTDRRISGRPGTSLDLNDSGDFGVCPTSATITWGDSSQPESAVPACNGTAFTLTRPHTYEQPGHYKIDIQYGGVGSSDLYAKIGPRTLFLGRTGSGTVTGQGITCPDDCTEDYSEGAMVPLMATPDPGWIFVGWNGGGCSGVLGCQPTLEDDRVVSATFARRLDPLITSVENLSTTDTTASIRFTIDPNGAETEYVLRYRIGQGQPTATAPVSIGSGAPQTFTRTLSGLNPKTHYSWEVVATNSGGSAEDGMSFFTDQQLIGRQRSAVTLTENGDGCTTYAMVDWGDGTRQQRVDTPCAGGAFFLEATHVYEAGGRFHIQIAYPESGNNSEAWAEITPLPKLSVTRTGPGRVTGPGIDCGDDCEEPTDGTVTLTATPDANAVFDGWAGACSGTASCTVTLDADKTVTARFSPVQTQPAEQTPTPTPTPTTTPTPGPVPVYQQTVVAVPTGTVLVKLKGTNKYVPLKPGSLPLGAQIDATKGRVTITSVPRAGAPPESATFYGGIFTITQSGGITTLRLSGPEPTCKKGARASAGKKVKSRKLWGDGKGAFRTSGKYSAATVRGTRWLVQDTCAGTLTKVTVGVVSVRDTVRGKTITLRAGKSYTARPRR